MPVGLVRSVAWEANEDFPFASPLFFLLITSITILCNFRWCESSRVLRAVWSHRANDDGKPVLWSPGYNEVMETSTLWPGAASRWAWARHLARAGRCAVSGSVGCRGTARLRALPPGRSAPGTSISLASEETPVWAQAPGFAPSACCPPSFWVPCSVTSFSLPPLLQRTSNFFKGFLCCSQKHQLESWNSLLGKWRISKCCFPAAVMLWDYSLCSLASLAAELNSRLSEADMVCYFLFHLIVCRG